MQETRPLQNTKSSSVMKDSTFGESLPLAKLLPFDAECLLS